MIGTLERSLQHRPIRLVRSGPALITPPLPPAEDDIATKETALIVPAPGAVVGSGRIGAQITRTAAADVIADVTARIAGDRPTRNAARTVHLARLRRCTCRRHAQRAEARKDSRRHGLSLRI